MIVGLIGGNPPLPLALSEGVGEWWRIECDKHQHARLDEWGLRAPKMALDIAKVAETKAVVCQ